MKLYNRDAKGAIREWSIDIEGQELVIRFGQQGGVIQEKREYIPCGKASRSLEEQMYLQMASRINKQKDKGYQETVPQVVTNTLGFQKPMLALREERVKNVPYSNGVYIQRKYDGHRCLVTRDGDTLTAYSRNGKRITTIEHILSGINIPNGCTLDGELYVHGRKLQNISSMVKRVQPDNELLEYHVYDIIDPRDYNTRLTILDEYVPQLLVPTEIVYDRKDAIDLFAEFRAEGYEGAIVRIPSVGYEAGKRSKSLLKIKETFDAEYPVIRIEESKDAWAILVCRMESGKTFKVSAPGVLLEKRLVWEKRHEYIGRTVTVEWYGITEEGIPFHPVALRWKEHI